MPGIELLTTSQMAQADQLAIAAGVPSLRLMETAGIAVANAAAQRIRTPNDRILVLCGPGNNGGDGFVAARILATRGFDVRVAATGPKSALKSDAATMAENWTGSTITLDPACIADGDLIIDALFGAGLSKPLAGIAHEAVIAANQRRQDGHAVTILAVDVPSGLDGTTGQPLGSAIVEADVTVTFFRRKPGHLLLPGRTYCGDVVVADIGIPDHVLSNPTLAGAATSKGWPATYVNTPDLWRRALPVPSLTGHKYKRGHCLVASGPPSMTGAARLAARGALRIGAGLVTLASPPNAVLVNAAHLTAVMLTPMSGPEDVPRIVAERKITALILGPGNGVGANTRESVCAALTLPQPVVLDADALTSFEQDAGTLFQAIRKRAPAVTVLTPHDGELTRVFGGDVSQASRLERAMRAAQLSGAVVLLKGADTVIAEPDGRAAINANAPPALATAGSGDVLAGFVAGLLAQGMPPFEAASAAVWLHGACAQRFGPGLIAEDLPESLPGVLAELAAG